MAPENNQPTSDRERILARRKGKTTPPKALAEARAVLGDSGEDQEKPESFLMMLRGWADALVFAFLLAMFIRMYVFELFMIPTGSMTPPLIGDEAMLISEADWDGDGQEDIVSLGHQRNPRKLQVHLRNEDGEFDKMLRLDNANRETQQNFFDPNNQGMGRRDMIIVNKFSYWFSKPKRGDIIVFKTPDTERFPFQIDKPVFIKRCMGLPGESVTLQSVQPYTMAMPNDPERLTPPHYGGIEYHVNSRPILIDGEPLTGDPFDRLHHFPNTTFDPFQWPIPNAGVQTIDLAKDEVLMLGDNARNSQDGRYWGGVPLANLRGKAIVRHLPLRAMTFIEDGP